LDLPHISYLDGNDRNLKYARWDCFTWQIETVDSSGSVGYNASLALDSSDNPHIAYKDLTNNNLKYTLWNGFSWIFETTVGSRPSLTLDSSDKPYISFWGFYNNNYAMMYAWTNNPTDADGHSITYDLWYSTEADFSPHEEIIGLTDSEYQFGDAELDENNIYFWKVLATDSYHETWSNQTDWWFYMGLTAGMESGELTLSDPYPNPASTALTISYQLTQNGSVELNIYDLSGRLVETLVSGEQTAGRHSVNWDSSTLATGMYLIRLETAGEAITKRMVISR